jgi:hypothetical protein
MEKFISHFVKNQKIVISLLLLVSMGVDAKVRGQGKKSHIRTSNHHVTPEGKPIKHEEVIVKPSEIPAEIKKIQQATVAHQKEIVNEIVKKEHLAKASINPEMYIQKWRQEIGDNNIVEFVISDIENMEDRQDMQSVVEPCKKYGLEIALLNALAPELKKNYNISTPQDDKIVFSKAVEHNIDKITKECEDQIERIDIAVNNDTRLKKVVEYVIAKIDIEKAQEGGMFQRWSNDPSMQFSHLVHKYKDLIREVLKTDSDDIKDLIRPTYELVIKHIINHGLVAENFYTEDGKSLIISGDRVNVSQNGMLVFLISAATAQPMKDDSKSMKHYHTFANHYLQALMKTVGANTVSLKHVGMHVTEETTSRSWVTISIAVAATMAALAMADSHVASDWGKDSAFKQYARKALGLAAVPGKVALEYAQRGKKYLGDSSVGKYVADSKVGKFVNDKLGKAKGWFAKPVAK